MTDSANTSAAEKDGVLLMDLKPYLPAKKKEKCPDGDNGIKQPEIPSL